MYISIAKQREQLYGVTGRQIWQLGFSVLPSVNHYVMSTLFCYWVPWKLIQLQIKGGPLEQINNIKLFIHVWSENIQYENEFYELYWSEMSRFGVEAM